ncbi:hypothetical protein DICSQDRAFT_181274 [Dichomitus squalens LYAD-421 SS1]|uniref:GST N-terminal domain-containing protein n=1 Tax=Dichomitus squalens (strain LYAD-421) TaxID=732165 RepID=R7SWV7_DICSQ|nr:uncharacterized protein DICSQDRAFT_181274 [Dichomitus squalens LYAD-421 SS1]EJF60571.1 hypothetical protein DICSQDRAFT_181274 [Dichomitus squalens LYAD-421 SS1]
MPSTINESKRSGRQVDGVSRPSVLSVITCTKRTLTVAQELMLIEFNKGAHKTPEYLAHQPFGQVPYIEDDGLVLFERQRYRGHGEVRAGGQHRAMPPAVGLAIEGVFKPFFGQQTDTTAVEAEKGESKMMGTREFASR